MRKKNTNSLLFLIIVILLLPIQTYAEEDKTIDGVGVLGSNDEILKLYDEKTIYDDVWLQEKVDAGGTINLEGDVVLKNTIALSSNSITIDGGNSKYSIKLADDFQGRHFNGGATLKFKNLRLLGHNSEDAGRELGERVSGGGIKTSRGSYQSIIFENCDIIGNHIKGMGSVAELGNTPITFKDCLVMGNSSTDFGGVIASNNNVIKFEDTTAKNNACYNGQGGVIGGNYANVFIDDSVFEGNYARYNGGAISPGSANLKKIEINKTIFKDNKSDDNGGAIYANTVIPTYGNISGCEFIGNEAIEGGAVSQNGRLYYKNSIFKENEATKTGGAIHIVNRHPYLCYIDNVDFEGNRASKDGIYWEVENPRGGPSVWGLDGQYKFVMGQTIIAPDGETKVPPYSEIVVNMNGKNYSKAIKDGVVYTNPFNNHDIAYDTEYTVYFYNSNTGINKFVRFGNKEDVVAPEGFEKFPGFIFKGWKVAYYQEPKSNNLGWIPDSWDKDTPYMFNQNELTGNVYLLPTWEKAATVVYYLNDGSENKKYLDFEKGSTITIESLSNVDSEWKIPDGKIFDSWNTEPDGSGIKYEVGKTFEGTEDYLELYAHWKEKRGYTVNYDKNGADGGAIPIDFQSPYEGNSKVTVLGNTGNLVKDGYEFKGWNTKADGTGTTYNAGDTFNILENTSLYAIWNKLDSEPEVDKPTDYSSIIWDWGHEPVKEDTKLHRAYINGYPDGSVKPQGEITRGEVAAIMSRLHADVEEIDYSTETKYSDVKSTDWYAKHIAYVSDKGLMEGYEDGTFKPEEKITRAEYATVVARFKNLEQVETTFGDSIDHWANGYIGAVASEKWITGYPDGSFKPANNISREEVATMTNKMLDRKVDEAGINNLPIKKFIDLEFGTWSYYEIVEASNTHEYVRRDSNLIVEDWKEIIEK